VTDSWLEPGYGGEVVRNLSEGLVVTKENSVKLEIAKGP
jgi:hypothetical protein